MNSYPDKQPSRKGDAPPLSTAKNEGGHEDFGDLLLSVSGDIALLFIRERLAKGAKLHIATSDGKSAPPKEA